MELTYDAISKAYGKKQALSQVSVTLTRGVYGLLGPNGAGKSTLINILAGNVKADSGCIYWNGQDIKRMGRAFRAKLGYMPQQQALYPSFSVTQFLSYIAALRGLDPATARMRIPQVLAQVDLSTAENQRIETMSGGMRQRLLIAQAVLADPEIVVLDEPTAGLDPEQRISVRNLIGAMSVNKIVIVSTHIVSDIEFIAKSLLLLRGGVLLSYADCHALLASLNGKVFELDTTPAVADHMKKEYKVGSVAYGEDTARVHFLSEEVPAGRVVSVPPSLEDVYIQFFRDRL